MRLPQRTDSLPQPHDHTCTPTPPGFVRISDILPDVIDFIIQQAAQQKNPSPPSSGERCYVHRWAA